MDFYFTYRKGRETLNRSAEISFYVDYKLHGQGIGTELVQFSLNQASQIDKSVYLAIIIEGNQGSIQMLKKLGFEQCGYLPEVVNYRNEKRGQVYMGKVLD
ncbi:MAG: GNAT family N-acetyltransferase [Balneola sp.]